MLVQFLMSDQVGKRPSTGTPKTKYEVTPADEVSGQNNKLSSHAESREIIEMLTATHDDGEQKSSLTNSVVKSASTSKTKTDDQLLIENEQQPSQVLSPSSKQTPVAFKRSSVPKHKQLRIMIVKNFLQMSSHLFLFIFQIVWPTLVFAVLLGFIFLYLNIGENKDIPSCFLRPRALPSAGYIPFMQSFMCSRYDFDK